MALNISFKGKRVLITGASRGLGRDLVSVFHSDGAIVYALARNPKNLAQLALDFPGIYTIEADISNWDETKEKVEALGPMDHLINNAGISYEEPFLKISPEHFEEIMNINLMSVINISQVVIKGMIENKIAGSIVNVSSMGSKLYMKLSTSYCVSKACLDSLTTSMCGELNGTEIRVNSVNPTLFETDMTKEFLTCNPGGGEYYINRCPMGRIAQSYEVVNTILFLLSGAAPMIHGERVMVDGGYTTV